MKTDNLNAVALTFLNQHEGEHLLRDRHHLVDRCTAHLVDCCNVSRLVANDITMQALGELDARNRRAYIDCTRTTSYTLFLVNAESGERRTFTISQLLEILEAHQAGTAL